MFNLPGTRVYVVDGEPESARGLLEAFATTGHGTHRCPSPLAVASAGHSEVAGDLRLDGSLPEAALVNAALQMAGQYPDRTILLWLDRQ